SNRQGDHKTRGKRGLSRKRKSFHQATRRCTKRNPWLFLPCFVLLCVASWINLFLEVYRSKFKEQLTLLAASVNQHQNLRDRGEILGAILPDRRLRLRVERVHQRVRTERYSIAQCDGLEEDARTMQRTPKSIECHRRSHSACKCETQLGRC